MGKGKEVIREAGRSPGSGGGGAASCNSEGEVPQPLPVSQGLFSPPYNPSPRLGASKEGAAGIQVELSQVFLPPRSGGRRRNKKEASVQTGTGLQET